MPRTRVFALRRQAVEQPRGLIGGDYRPSPIVFQIEDGRPWWGVVGQFYHGRGKRSIEGPSEESRLIINPYLLVSAEFLGLSPYRRGWKMWDWKRFAKGVIDRADFPFVIKPHSLRYFPAKKSASVTYSVSLHLINLNRVTTRVFRLSDATFELYTYNARDLGLSHLQIDLSRSQNVRQEKSAQSGMIALRHYLHRGGSCGYPGGCNNMSPDTPELSNFSLTALPARLELLLFTRAQVAHNAPSTLRYTLHFD